MWTLDGEGLALHLVEAGGQQLFFDVRGGRRVSPAAGCPGAVGSHGDLLELAQLRNQGFAGHRVRQCRTGAGGRGGSRRGHAGRGKRGAVAARGTRVEDPARNQ